MLAEQRHPQLDELAQYNLGKLSDEETAKIEDHVAQCEQCARTVVNMPGDTFLDLLRRSETTGSQVTELHGPASSDVANLASPPSAGGQATLPPDRGATKLSEEAVRRVLELPAELRQHGRYRIQECLGAGGMGSVYKAQHRLMNRPVALKVISPQFLNHPGAAERFEREVQAAARLSHPNIVAAYDADQAGGLHFLVMEHVEGVDLHQVIGQRGALPVAEACEYIRQAALGLQHAHEQGMVHRDIKPHNLMLVERHKAAVEGRETAVVKILDFGLASFASDMAAEEFVEGGIPPSASAPQLTMLGSMMGTPDYIAPEQASDAHTVDIRADIYSLGCTFYYLLVGRAPFHEGTVFDKIRAHSEQNAAPLAAIRNDVPPEVEGIVRKMMAKDAKDRHQTPQDVVDALTKLIDARIDKRLRQHGAGEPPMPLKPRPVSDSARRPIRIALLVGLACLGLAMVAGVMIYILTNNGTLVIEKADSRVRIAIDQRGKRISIVGDERSKQERVKLRVGEYDLKIIDSPSEMVVSENKVIIRRGGEQIVQVRYVPKGETASTDADRVKLPDWVGPEPDPKQPSPFFAMLGDLQGLVRKTVAAEGLNVAKIAPADKDVATVRSQLVLRAEVNGEEDRGAKLLTALRNSLKALSTQSEAFVSGIERDMRGKIVGETLTYQALLRDGIVRLELEPLSTDKRMPRIKTWSLVIRVEEWPKEQAGENGAAPD